MKEQIILIGTGGHALIVHDILKILDKYEIIGATSKDISKSNCFEGIPIIGDDSMLMEYYGKGIRSVAMGIGGFTNNVLRTSIFNLCKKIGFQVLNVIHPKAIISTTTKLGEGITIFPGVVLNTYVRIGNNVIIATNSTIDHESIVEDHSLISAGVTIGGYVLIREGALIALGAKIVSGIEVGKNALVASGAVVVSNVPDGSAVFGLPAKQR